jgi:hypothetical protein
MATAACRSFFVVPVSQKKGFGGASSTPLNKKKQGRIPHKDNDLLETPPSDAAPSKKAVLLRKESQELQTVIKSVEKVVAFMLFIYCLRFME